MFSYNVIIDKAVKHPQKWTVVSKKKALRSCSPAFLAFIHKAFI